MKRTIIISILVVSILAIACNTKYKEPLSLSVRIIGKNVQISNCNKDTVVTYPFRVTLRNNTDSSFCFWLRCCPYGDNFGFNSNMIEYISDYRDKESCELVNLKSFDEFSFNGNIRILNFDSVKPNHHLKLGFVLVSEKEFSDSSDNIAKLMEVIYKKGKDKNNIIWSNNINYNW